MLGNPSKKQAGTYLVFCSRRTEEHSMISMNEKNFQNYIHVRFICILTLTVRGDIVVKILTKQC